MPLLDGLEKVDALLEFAPAHVDEGFADVHDVEKFGYRQVVDRCVADFSAAVGDEDGRGPKDLPGPGDGAVVEEVELQRYEALGDLGHDVRIGERFVGEADTAAAIVLVDVDQGRC